MFGIYDIVLTFYLTLLKDPLFQMKRPVTYIELYHDCDIDIGMLIISGNARLPLHGHPKMRGILKVVHGEVEFLRFHKIPSFDINHDHTIAEVLRDLKSLIQ